MKSYCRTNYIISTTLIYLFMTIFLFVGCRSKETKTEQSAINNKPLSYSDEEINVENRPIDTLIYNPMNNSLSSIQKKKNTYYLSVWQGNGVWTTSVASWKIKKNESLDNFSYNTTGMLFACLKKYKKGRLYHQDIVRLRGNGSIQSLALIGLENVMLQPKTSKNSSLTEITDLQCCGTALAITYQYGSVKIYNIAEKQALGVNHLTGVSKHNIFYDLHYLTIKKGTSQEILLRDYDIRSGEISHTFPLGGSGQNSSDFYISNYQNELYLLSPKGLYTGSCTELVLTKQLDQQDIQLPAKHRITYFQAARDNTLFLGYKTPEKGNHLHKIMISS